MQHRLYQFLLITCITFGISTITTAQSVAIDSIITPSSLQQVVQVLAADSFAGRLTGTIQATKAALYISEEFKKAGVRPLAGNDGYIMPYKAWDKITAFNLVAALPGKSKAQELIIFSAHYDHIGTFGHAPPHQPQDNGKAEKGDIVYNGANDNASGISGLLALARYFALQPNRERTILFMAFSGEEEGLLGSRNMAANFDPKAIKMVINMDMIGRPYASSKMYPMITGNANSNLQALLNQHLFEAAPEYGENYFKGDWMLKDDLYRRSDNYAFVERGVTAHTILTTPDTDMYYHSLNDEWETLDFDFMTKVVKAIALGSTGLVDGTDTILSK